MIYTHLTVAELMARFQIRKELYNAFASWCYSSAEKYELLVPGTERARNKRYDAAKVAQHYPKKWHFGTAAPAHPELAAQPPHVAPADALRAEIATARRERRRAAVALIRNARRHASAAIIAQTHAELSEARCEKYLGLLGLEFLQQRVTRWAFLGTTAAALISSTVFIILNII